MEESLAQKKAARLIQQELSHVLSFEFRALPGTLLTLSLVRVTADLGLAKVYVSVLPEVLLEKTVHHLNDHHWELRRALTARLRNKFRKSVELRFYADDTLAEAKRINDLLDSLHGEEE